MSEHEAQEGGGGMDAGWGALEWLHRGADVGLGAAEHAVPEVGGLGLVMGPAGLALGVHTLMEGIEHGDATEVMEGGAGTIGGGASTIEGIQTVMEMMLGGGEAAEGGAAVAGAAAAEGGALGLGALGPAAAAFGAGAAVGHKVDRWANNTVKEHGWYGGMDSDEHRFSEGQKVDSGGTIGHIAGATRAVETAFEDDAMAVVNTGITGTGGGIADAITRQKNEAIDRHKVAEVLSSTQPTEEVSTRSSSTSHEDSLEVQKANAIAWRSIREMQDTIDSVNAGEIQMPEMDMRRHPAKH
jgi:hypothetical protein